MGLYDTATSSQFTQTDVTLCMRRFGEAGTRMLRAEGVSPLDAMIYPLQFYRADQIVALHKLGITCEDVGRFDVGILYNVLSAAQAFRHQKPAVLATGKNSIIFMMDGAVWKFGNHETLHRERGLLELIHRRPARHIVGLAPVGYTADYLPLEMVSGASLDALIKSRAFGADDALRYGHGIIQGLVEMRRAGVLYHNDIRPANIMLDGSDEPVIIDFGTATTSRHPPAATVNRRYGGMNDLISVAQIMYRMVAGRHLFNDSSMEETSMADAILARRKAVFGDRQVLESCLRAVDENAGSAAPVIRSLLLSRNHEYKKALRLF